MSGTYVLPTVYVPSTLWRYPNCGQWTHGPVIPGDENRDPRHINYCEEWRALPVAEWDAALSAAYARGREDAAKVVDELACYDAQHTLGCKAGFCGHARCGHIQACAAAIRAGGAP